MPVRPATLADQDAIVVGNAAMALETEGLVLDPATLRAGVRAVLAGEVPGLYRVVEKGGAVVSQMMITFEWSDWRNRMVWWIQSVYTSPSHRGQGHYRRLYAAVREEAVAAGAAGLRLYVDARNTAAQAVYGVLGMDGGHYRVFEAMFEVPIPPASPP